ncbi:hypothetical protein [Ruegeria sp.]|uniref:hypothetical protein n=1 Tax=Ruegeria sp. TaxID=1879320 RepID=UPI00230CF759|nr:hypothetical protein [Ruegeria sp.]MDA7963165.1 hypothetical protein [Ruegeria sp.]
MSQIKSVFLSAMAALVTGGFLAGAGHAQTYTTGANESYKRIPVASANISPGLHIPTKLNRHFGVVQRSLPYAAHPGTPQVEKASARSRSKFSANNGKRIIRKKSRPHRKFRHHSRFAPKYSSRHPVRPSGRYQGFRFKFHRKHH